MDDSFSSMLASQSDNMSSVDEHNRKEKLISVLTDILTVHKKLHYGKLCFYNGCCKTEVADYFTSYSNIEKYNFFKNHAEYFSMGVGGYVTLCGDDDQNMNCPHALTSDTLTYKDDTMGQPRPNSSSWKRWRRQKKPIIDILKNVLKQRKRMHYKDLCTANKRLLYYFQDFTTRKLIQYFQCKPTCFIITSTGQVSLYEGDKNLSKFSTSSCNNSLVSKPVSCKYISSVTEKSTKSRIRQKMENVCQFNDTSSALHIQTDFACTVENSRNNSSASSIQATPAPDPSYVDNTFSPIHKKDVIEVFKAHLNLNKCMHYLELCAYLEKSNKLVRAFFASLSSYEKLDFFEDHPWDFHVNANDYISLSKYADDILDTPKSPSRVSLKNLRIIENEVIDILIDALKVSQPIHFEKLCKYNDKVENFFMSYSISEKFKFFNRFPKKFYLRRNVVRLSTNIDYYSSLSDDASSTTTVTKNPPSEHNVNYGNDEIKCGNYNSAGPFQENLFHISDREISASDRLTLRTNDARNLINSKIFNKKSVYLNSISSYGDSCTSNQVENITISKDISSSDRYITFRDEKPHKNNFEIYSGSKNYSTDNKENVTGELCHWSNEQPICGTMEERLSQTKTVIESLNYESYCDKVGESQSDKIDSMYIRQEVMETLIDQLKIYKSMNYLKLYEVCEQCNSTVRNFFYTFSNAEKLCFLKSHPHFFFVDGSNFVTISCDMNSSSNDFAACETNSCSDQYVTTDRRTEKLADFEDTDSSGSSATLPHHKRYLKYKFEKCSTGNNHCKQRSTKDPSHNKNAIDERNDLCKQEHIRELLGELNSVAKCFDPDLEMRCIEFFENVIQKNPLKSMDINFLHRRVSQSPDSIRTYLARYTERDLLLFFYLHLDHFCVNSSGYVSLRIAPVDIKYDRELEKKSIDFFTSFVNIASKNKVRLNLLENCLNIASDEVQLYLRKTYSLNLKLFFSNHSDHFVIDTSNNISLK